MKDTNLLLKMIKWGTHSVDSRRAPSRRWSTNSNFRLLKMRKRELRLKGKTYLMKKIKKLKSGRTDTSMYFVITKML